MLFRVERTSTQFTDEPPCEEAQRTDCKLWPQWVVDCDLLEFIAKYGQCVVSPAGDVEGDDKGGMWTVEIYDGWRE
jgi:hypothetical protein